MVALMTFQTELVGAQASPTSQPPPKLDTADLFKLADVDTDAPSSESDEGSNADETSSVSHVQQDELHLSKAWPIPVAAALWPRHLLGVPVREVVDASSADSSQPCWLVPHGNRCAILQAQLPSPDLSDVESSPLAPPPGLPLPSEGCWQQDRQASVQSGEQDTSSSSFPPSPASAPLTPQLSCTMRTDTIAKVTWVVDARRLQSKDKMLVSPAFELPLGRPVPFRLMLQPKSTSGAKGAESFARARGLASVQLKCEESLKADAAGTSVVAFRVAAGPLSWRGPVRHDFAGTSAASLPSNQRMWDLRTATDSESRTVTIHLDVECA